MTATVDKVIYRLTSWLGLSAFGSGVLQNPHQSYEVPYSAQIRYLLLACGGVVLAPKVERPGVVVISPRGGAAARQVLSSSGSRAQAVQAGTLFFSPSNFNLTRSDKI